MEAHILNVAIGRDAPGIQLLSQCFSISHKWRYRVIIPPLWLVSNGFVVLISKITKLTVFVLVIDLSHPNPLNLAVLRMFPNRMT
jgi:hypothetical protein